MASTCLSTVTVFVCGHSMSSTLPWRKPLTAFGELSLWLAVCTSVLQSNIYKLVDQMCALNHQNVAMVLIFQVYCSQHVRFMRTPVFDLSKSSGGGVASVQNGSKSPSHHLKDLGVYIHMVYGPVARPKNTKGHRLRARGHCNCKDYGPITHVSK